MPPPQETPHKRKQPQDPRLPGICKLNMTVDKLSDMITSRLQLPFKPEAWQATLIHKIAQGHDSILCASTGYGKSLIFKGSVFVDEAHCIDEWGDKFREESVAFSQSNLVSTGNDNFFVQVWYSLRKLMP
ncbi:hypothetical protein K439DRAFT_1620139 [Ramaria rubella]|nr:hypothetical protein K439DRAFT_1620139 [Ramaria rubella]